MGKTKILQKRLFWGYFKSYSTTNSTFLLSLLSYYNVGIFRCYIYSTFGEPSSMLYRKKVAFFSRVFTCRWGTWEILMACWNIWENQNSQYCFFFLLYFKSYQKTDNIFSLALLRYYMRVSLDFMSNVSFSRNHHQRFFYTTRKKDELFLLTTERFIQHAHWDIGEISWVMDNYKE